MRILAKSAVVAATVSPALATAGAAEVEAPPTPSPRTLIGELWAQRTKVRQEYKATDEIRKRLEDELQRLMPKPRPSITYSPENDADGLKHKNPHSDTMHGYIPSDLIEENLNNIQPTTVEAITVDDCQGFVFRKEPLPLSPRQTALKERPTARLGLSKKYERKIERVESKIGLTAANKKLDKLCDQQLDLENQIMSARCTTRSDFAVKLTIYDFHGRDGVDAESIIEDFRRAIEVPASAPPFDFTV